MCDYCGTKQLIGATDNAETLCPKCGAKRHEVIEKKLLKKQVETKKVEPSKQPEPKKENGGCAWNGLGKILLFIIVIILIGSVVYIVNNMM